MTRRASALDENVGDPMASGDRTEGTPESPADPRVVASVIKEKPPVELLREDIKVVDRFGSVEVANGLADVIEQVELSRVLWGGL